MRHTEKNRFVNSQAGFSLIEMMVALFLGGIISLFALNFYINQHETYLTQQSISEMQQNLRASLTEINDRLMNAGANLPAAIQPLGGKNSDPDSITIRFAVMGGAIAVGDHTQKLQAAPIHIDNGTDLSSFSANQRVYLWHSTQNVGEWFTISSVKINSGSGWYEIHHQGQELLFDPEIGDNILALQEMSYFIDNSDSTKPLLMKAENGLTPQIFADYVDDLQIKYILKRGDTVDVLTVADTVVAANVYVSALTSQKDYESPYVTDGIRRRSASTEVFIRNGR